MFVLALGGCSGAGHSTSLPTVAQGQAKHVSLATATAGIVLVNVLAPRLSGTTRYPARFLTVGADNNTPTQTIDLATGAGCVARASGQMLCAMELALTAGPHVLDVATYDEPFTPGHSAWPPTAAKRLSLNEIPVQVGSNVTTVNADMYRPPATLEITPQSSDVFGSASAGYTLQAALATGTNAAAFFVVALDAEKSVIVGPAIPVFEVSTSNPAFTVAVAPYGLLAVTAPTVAGAGPAAMIKVTAGASSLAFKVTSPVLDRATATITASTGGTLHLPGGSSVTIPPGMLSSNQNVSAYVLSQTTLEPANPLYKTQGPALFVALDGSSQPPASVDASPGLSKRRIDAAAGPNMTLNFVPPPDANVPIGGPPPVIHIAAASGTFDGSFPYSWGSTGVSVSVPAMLAPTNVTVYMAAYPAQNTPPSFGVRQLDLSAPLQLWSSNVTIDPGARTIIFVHGVGSSVETAFPDSAPACAQAIAEKGNYKQVLGYDYDWAMDPAVSAAGLQDILTKFNQSNPVDIEAHSLGTIVTLFGVFDAEAASSEPTPVGNVVLLGGPLNGSPLLSSPIVNMVVFNTAGLFASNFQTAEMNALPDTLGLNSAALQQAKANFLLAVPYSPVGKLLLVAGTKPFSFESAAVGQNYLALYSLGLVGFPSLLPMDGLVQQSSALSSYLLEPSPNPYGSAPASMAFPLTHVDLECTPSVQDWVKTQLYYMPKPTIPNFSTNDEEGLGYTQTQVVKISSTTIEVDTHDVWPDGFESKESAIASATAPVQAAEFGPSLTPGAYLIQLGYANLSVAETTTVINEDSGPCTLDCVSADTSNAQFLEVPPADGISDVISLEQWVVDNGASAPGNWGGFQYSDALCTMCSGHRPRSIPTRSLDRRTCLAGALARMRHQHSARVATECRSSRHR